LLLGSNTTDLHSQKFRRQFDDTLRHFDHLVMSFDIGQRKPKPEFYAHCQSHAQCEPSECVFVDDLPANIAAAEQHGWHGALYTSFAHLQRRFRTLGIDI
jgi:putative hydrolase of the HAD superfamily